MRVLDSFIQTLEMDKPHTHKNLSISFFHRQGSRSMDMLNYDEALDAKMLEVTEVSTGSVPELRFQNKSAFPVFIPEGTIIEGLKQSRSIRVSFVIREKSEVTCPVHCVEANRWDAVKMGFKSPFHLNAKLRAANLRHTSDSHKEKEGYNSRSSQSDTWERIRRMKEKKERELGRRIHSKGDYVGDIFKEDGQVADEYLKSFSCPDTATGLLAMINNQVVGADIFGDRKLFERNFNAIMRGLVADAIAGQDVQLQKQITPEDFMRSIVKAKKERYVSIGSGIDLRFESDKVIGCALIVQEVCHLEAFVQA